MIPATSSQTTSAIGLFGDSEPSIQLTVSDVIKSTYIKSSHVDSAGEMSFRYQKNACWYENDDIASLSQRVDFINKTVDHVKCKFPKKDAVITLVSFGSGGLLTEIYINKLLYNSGYKNIKWRVIDFGYQTHLFDDAINDFKGLFKGGDSVQSFGCDREYLGSDIAKKDKMQGATVVLSVCPPTELRKAVDVSDCLRIRAKIVSCDELANSIYFLVADTQHRKKLEDAMDNLFLGDTVFFSDSVMRVSINSRGDCNVISSPSFMGMKMKYEVKPYINKLKETAKAVNQVVSLRNVDKILEKYSVGLAERDCLGVKFYASDYDSGLSDVIDFFEDDNDKITFASFERNETTFDAYPKSTLNAFSSGENSLASLLSRMRVLGLHRGQ